ncbi:methyl-accepting chemotaxis protein [Dethiosulfovibrio salsuginis]|uniref:Methyl-accepting chemotaxis sensory transducer with Cache sensor n=1 Tax=Dethiosulfovibrio salsuginis TaxID=561720 RepID=A0A1X7IQM6_9BACT|nr:methyl-accepting chemotaxis protein [Dethiosulfovibrio salsuginis]SMG17418.1 methyl-accepting chemotaxis sensory transducer with Cache sensor [Dethiosulfovibrio salsuginis]
MRSWGLKAKLLGVIISVSFLAFALAVGILTYRAGEMALESAYRIGEETSIRYGTQVSEYLGRALTHGRDLSVNMATLVSQGMADRELGISLLRATVESNPQLLGAWAVFEPGAFDGKDDQYVGKPGHDHTGRFIPYLVRSEGSIILDPSVEYETSDYYLVPIKTGKPLIFDPAEWEVGGKMVMMTSLCVPVLLDGKPIGVVGVDIAMETFQALFASIKPFGTGYAGLLSDLGTYVAYPDRSLVGTTLSDSEAMAAVTGGKLFSRTVVSAVTGDKVYETFQPVAVDRYGSPWSVEIALPYDMIYRDARSILFQGILVGCVALLLLSGVILVFVGKVVRPVKVASALAERAKDGDLSISRDDFQTRSSDEVGLLADSLSSMIQGLRNMVVEITKEAQTVSDRSSSLAAFSQQSNASMEEIWASVEKVTAMADKNSAALSEGEASVQEVAESAQMTARSATEGAEASQKSSDENQKAVEKVVEAIGRMEEARSVSEDSIVRIKSLGESVDSIGGFVGDITRIADQTNLLALNAAIEAARAGEAGRGFAVVADEVRKLAEESARSAENVGKIISLLQSSSQQSIEATERTGSILEGAMNTARSAQEQLGRAAEIAHVVNESIQSIAAVAEEQAASSEEMASSMDQIGRGNLETVRMIESIREASEETARASESVSQEAQDVAKSAGAMMDLVRRFKLSEENRSVQVR